jgi:dolichyl-phosphate beta-glucosyltransferase
MTNDIYLSVVIPAYNEEKRIGTTLKRISDYLLKKDYLYEIIVVDDGSVDGTCRLVGEIAEQIPCIRLLKNGVNRGKGYSVRKGGYNIVIGSRALPESEILLRQTWYRECMGKIFNRLVQLLAIPEIKDTQCGFKLFKRKVAGFLFERQRIDGFGFDAEILFIARKSGYKVREVPVRWINSPDSRVHILKDSILMLRDLLIMRINYLIGGTIGESNQEQAEG